MYHDHCLYVFKQSFYNYSNRTKLEVSPQNIQKASAVFVQVQPPQKVPDPLYEIQKVL